MATSTVRFFTCSPRFTRPVHNSNIFFPNFSRHSVSTFTLGARSRRLKSTSIVNSAAAVENEAPVKDDAKPERKKRVLSGVQPTGDLHLGNYLGAIRNWVALQDSYDTFFCVVDLHAITVQHDPKVLLNATRTSAATYLAAGIDPAKSTIFVQSHVPAHTELTWLLNCTTPIGWLERMIQYKEKAKKAGENVSLGLLGYPVLMAADILVYGSDLVPVGEDQRQHLELARDIAKRVNDQYGGRKWKKLGGRGGKVLTVPEALIPPAGARVMSLLDGTSKMSKSAEAAGSRINLTDSKDQIQQKIKRCKTDSFDGLVFDDPARPEANNLLSVYQLMSGKTKEDVAAECASMRWGEFKPVLTDACVAHLEPIQKKYAEVMEDTTYLDSLLADGAEKANQSAEWTLKNVKQSMGFMPPIRK